MLKTIFGIFIFLVGVSYGIYNTILIMQQGIYSVPYLDFSEIVKGVALPLPLIVSICLAALGIFIAYSDKKKKQ